MLKESNWLKEDLDEVRKEYAEKVSQQSKAEHDIEAFAELRGAHRSLQEELSGSRHECAELRRELIALKSAHANKIAREQELQREVARLDSESRKAVERSESVQQKFDEARQELFEVKADLEDAKRRLLSNEDEKTRCEGIQKALQKERDELKKDLEELQAKRQQRKKNPNPRSLNSMRWGRMRSR